MCEGVQRYTFLQTIQYIHPENRRFIEQKSKRLSARSEVIYNFARKAPPRPQKDRENPKAKVIVHCFIGCLLAFGGIIILWLALRSLIDAVLVKKVINGSNLVSICFLTVLSVAGLSFAWMSFRDLIYVFNPVNLYLRQQHAKLIQKGVVITGEILSSTSVSIHVESKQIIGTEIRCGFTTPEGTGVESRYVVFKPLRMTVGTSIQILYLNFYLHLPL
jgi:hypothetical protein